MLFRMGGCRTLLFGGFAILWGVALLGCGGADVGRVSGKVVFPGGKPLPQGSVVFENKEKGISVGAPIGPDGTYTVKTYDRVGLPPGTYKVAITPTTFGTDETPFAEPPSKQSAGTSSEIPRKYRSTATSGLSITVQPGPNPPYDIELKP